MTLSRCLRLLIPSLAWMLLAARPCLALPDPARPVSDFANVLSDAREQELLAMIRALEADTTAEVAVVTVSSLDGMSVEEYANALFTKWGLGRASIDNGVLILVATGDREMRIEVGYGLEGILPDGLAGDIIRKQFLPRFKEGDYEGGILDGTTRVIDIVRARHVLTDEEKRALEDDAQGPVWVLVPFLGVFVVLGFLGLGAGLRNKVFVPSFFGLFFGGLPLLMGAGAVPRLGVIILVCVAAAALTLGLRKGKAWRSHFRDARSSRGDGWTMGSSSSSSSGSSSSSDSYGGGSSGGGGASGSW